MGATANVLPRAVVSAAFLVMGVGLARENSETQLEKLLKCIHQFAYGRVKSPQTLRCTLSREHRAMALLHQNYEQIYATLEFYIYVKINL